MVSTPVSSARSTASSSKHFYYSTPTKALFHDDENSYSGCGNTPYNGSRNTQAADAAKQRFSKRTRVGNTPLKNANAGINRDDASDFLNWKQMQLEKKGSLDSDVESEATSYAASSVAASSVVSVSQMRGWLNDFEKQNKAHYSKVNEVGKHPNGVALSKPHRPKCAAQQAAAMVVVKNLTTSKDGSRGPAKTPVRFKPRYAKDDVEATNDGYASVQKLSAWLADDPTSAKKVKTLRKGINVISKSRMFEKDMANVIIEENDIRHGSVPEKRRAFHSQTQEADGEEEDDAASVSVGDKKQWLQNAFQKAPRATDEQSDISVMSVSDKKKWLQNAFAKEERSKMKRVPVGVQRERPVLTTSLPKREDATQEDRDERREGAETTMKTLECVPREEEERVQSCVSTSAPMQNKPWKKSQLRNTYPQYTIQRPPRCADEMSDVSVMSVSEKKKWLQNAFVKEQGGTRAKHESVDTNEERKVRARSFQNREERRENQEEKIDLGHDLMKTRGSMCQGEEVRDPRCADMRVANEEANPSVSAENDEDRVVDFKAARELLVQRSLKNGNAVPVWSKVQKRRQKFESLEKERIRGSGPKGLLKPTWETADPSEGSSISYTKNFVEDIAPKRSFEELP